MLGRCLPPQPRPVNVFFFYRCLDNDSTIFYSSYCASPVGKVTFVGEWWGEVNDRDRYTSPNIRVHNTVTLTSSYCPAWRGSAQGECYRRLSELKNAEKVGAEHIQDVDHIKFESNGLPDRVPGDSTCLSHTSVVQDLLSTGKCVIY